MQVDVTFLKLVGKDGRATRRYQYTALDDATRIRALKVYTRHTQKNAMHFLDYVIKKFPFRLHTGRTDRGHEFQAQFPCVYITPVRSSSTASGQTKRRGSCRSASRILSSSRRRPGPLMFSAAL